MTSEALTQELPEAVATHMRVLGIEPDPDQPVRVHSMVWDGGAVLVSRLRCRPTPSYLMHLKRRNVAWVHLIIPGSHLAEFHLSELM